MRGSLDRLDRFQRRHPVVGFPLGVVYKFADDQGNYLAATITYYAFVAIFPLLLIASSVLGFVLQGNARLQHEVLASALRQFPIVGTQLGRPEGLQGSAVAVVVGFLAALYGVLGLGGASQNAMNAAWAVPRNTRANPFVSRFRSLVLLVVAGMAILLVAVLTSVGSNAGALTSGVGVGLGIGLQVASVLVNALVLAVLFKLGTSRPMTLGAAIPGALTTALLWQLLQQVGGIYVQHVVAKANTMNGVFALVLGLVALLYLAALMGVLGVEVNVVRENRLFPRALLTPFTDRITLTDADRRAYAAYAQAQRHKGFQRVHVEFEDGEPGE